MNAEEDKKIESLPTLRQKTFELLDTGSSSITGKLVDWFLMALIAINVFAVIMETIDSFQVKYVVALYWLELFEFDNTDIHVSLSIVVSPYSIMSC